MMSYRLQSACALAVIVFASFHVRFSDSIGLEHTGHYIRENINNLDAILRTASFGPLVACTIFTADWREFAVNWLYTITHYGRVESVLVATLDDASLRECLGLGLPCYNASNLFANSTLWTDTHSRRRVRRRLSETTNASTSSETTATPSSKDTQPADKVTKTSPGSSSSLSKAKPLLIRAIMLRNYSVLYTDVHTVWLKDASHSFVYSVDVPDADFSAGGPPGNVLIPDGSSFYFRNNNRTRLLTEAWVNVAMGLGGADSGSSSSAAPKDGGEPFLAQLSGDRFSVCSTEAECNAVKAGGKAALVLHPGQCCTADKQAQQAGAPPSCGGLQGGLCGKDVAYVRLSCAAEGAAEKKEYAHSLGLWFVDLRAGEPAFAGARAMDLVNTTHLRHHLDHVPHPWLPCDHYLAWVDGASETHTT